MLNFHSTLQLQTPVYFYFQERKRRKPMMTEEGSQRGGHLMTHISSEKEAAHNQRGLSCCSHVGVWAFRMRCDVTRLMPCQQKMTGKFSVSHTKMDLDLPKILFVLFFQFLTHITITQKKIREPISFYICLQTVFPPLLQPFKAVLLLSSSSLPQHNGLLASPHCRLLQLLARSTSSSSGLMKAGGRQQLTPRRSPGDN